MIIELNNLDGIFSGGNNLIRLLRQLAYSADGKL
jgi:hypothetical protein